jgi:outer membrane protein
MKAAWLTAGLVAAAVAAGTPAMAQAPAPAAGAASAVKIAYVDVQRVLARSAAGVAAREQLEREKATMQKEMDAKRVELEKLREEIEKKGPLMAADARRDKQDQFDRKRRDAARLADDFQKELEKKEQGFLQKVLVDVQVVVDRISKQRGFHMVVERQRAGVIYASPEADLTDEIIRAYDQEAGAKGKK